MKMESFDNANENGYFQIQCVLNTLSCQCEHQKLKHLNTLTMATKYVLSSKHNLKNFEIENSQWTSRCNNKIFHDLLLFNFIHSDANLLRIFAGAV